MIRESLLALAGLAAARGWASGAVEPLDIKPGLWEITLTVRSSGVPPIHPDAQAHRATGPRTTIKRSCLDENELRQGLGLTFGAEGQGCRQTLTNASRTAQEIRVECAKGASRGGGMVKIDAMDSEHVKVSSQWSAADSSDTHALRLSSTATLRWIGAVCDAVFPAAPQDTAARGVPTPPAQAAAPKFTPPSSRPLAAPAHVDGAYYYKLGREQSAHEDFPEALRSLTRALELQPQNAASYNARGYVYLRLRNLTSAIADFSAAIRLRPDYSNAYRNRAIARRRAGDESGAAADNSKAAELENRR